MSSNDPYAKLPNLTGQTAPGLDQTRGADPQRSYPPAAAGVIDPIVGRVLDVPRACIYQGTVQNVPAAVLTVVNLNTMLFDSDGMWNPAVPNRLTCRTPGVYAAHGNLSWLFNTSSYREAYFRVSNAQAYSHSVVDPSQVTVTEQGVSWPIALNAGDYVELVCSHNITGGGTLATNAGLSETALALVLSSTFGSDNQ